ncbi:MAG: hypothetical protein C0410_06670 [Anaerolinea sp.]|nr:hypothetical protein [Anaerolinea sp.]
MLFTRKIKILLRIKHFPVSVQLVKMPPQFDFKIIAEHIKNVKFRFNITKGFKCVQLGRENDNTAIKFERFYPKNFLFEALKSSH